MEKKRQAVMVVPFSFLWDSLTCRDVFVLCERRIRYVTTIDVPHVNAVLDE